MSRREYKITVGCEQRQLVTDAKLRDDGVDRADLQAGATTAIAQLRGVDMIQSVRSQERQRRKPVNDVFSRTRAGKSLQQFLQDETCDDERFANFESMTQDANFRCRGSLVAAEGKRPDAGIDEQGHRRERSAL